MSRPKGIDEERKERDAEIYRYYSNLISKAVGYTKSRARELTKEKFSSWNISERRIQDIVTAQKSRAEKEMV